MWGVAWRLGGARVESAYPHPRAAMGTGFHRYDEGASTHYGYGRARCRCVPHPLSPHRGYRFSPVRRGGGGTRIGRVAVRRAGGSSLRSRMTWRRGGEGRAAPVGWPLCVSGAPAAMAGSMSVRAPPPVTPPWVPVFTGTTRRGRYDEYFSEECQFNSYRACQFW